MLIDSMMDTCYTNSREKNETDIMNRTEKNRTMKDDYACVRYDTRRALMVSSESSVSSSRSIPLATS